MIQLAFYLGMALLALWALLGLLTGCVTPSRIVATVASESAGPLVLFAVLVGHWILPRGEVVFPAYGIGMSLCVLMVMVAFLLPPPGSWLKSVLIFNIVAVATWFLWPQPIIS